MDGKVVSIDGGAVVLPSGEVRPEIVKLAKRALSEARAGQLRGLAVVMYHNDYCCTHVFDGEVGLGVIGALERLKYRLLMDHYEE